MLSVVEMCGSAMAMIDPSSEAVNAMRHSEAMTSQNVRLLRGVSIVVCSLSEAFSARVADFAILGYADNLGSRREMASRYGIMI